MKYYNLIKFYSLSLFVGIVLMACTNGDDDSLDNHIVKMEDGSYVMDIDFDCNAPVYDKGTTRASTTSWGGGATILARLKSGSTYIKGMVVHNADGSWKLRWWGDLAKTTTATNCELYYFQESNGDYYAVNADTKCFDIYNNGTLVRQTDIPWNTDALELSETTEVYGTTAGTYKYPGDHFAMKATLDPLFWRLRFSGSNGTSITLPGSDNDMKYCSSFTWTASSTSLSKAAKDVSLKVSSSYTPYIYGEFTSTGSNKITVKNGNDTYTRNLNASSLPVGTSGYFDIPTASNYSSKGWTKVASAQEMVLKDFLVKPMGTVNVDMKTASYQTIRDEVAKSYSIYDSNTGDDPWLYMRASDNPSCSNMVYQGVPFDCFYVFSYTNSISISYYFVIDKSQASYDYTGYLNKMLQDYKNLNITMTKTSSESELASYSGKDAASNSYSIDVREKGDNNDKYEFWIWISYKRNSSSNIDASATVEPDYLVTFTDGIALDFKIGSTVNTFDFTVFTKTGAEALSDDELAEETYGTSPLSKSDADYIFKVTSTDFFKPNTEYYLCAVAKNSSGKRGPVCRYLFKTNAEGLPSAPISNITAESTTKWTYNITLRNGATSYYLATSTDENRYNSDWHYWAYFVHYWATTGQIEAHDWASVQTTLNSGTCKVITIGTWGIGSNGKIGNPEVSYGSTSSSAPARKPSVGNKTLQKERIPKADLEEMMKNTRLYRVTR